MLAKGKSSARRFGSYLEFSIHITLLQIRTIVYGIFFFRFYLSRVHREESALLHRVAFRILHACSVVFMIMRFPRTRVSNWRS
jgi:hypothetical protein